jgi:hypothetical protein
LIEGYVESEVEVANDPVLGLVQADSVAGEGSDTDTLPGFRPPTLIPPTPHRVKLTF